MRVSRYNGGAGHQVVKFQSLSVPRPRAEPKRPSSLLDRRDPSPGRDCPDDDPGLDAQRGPGEFHPEPHPQPVVPRPDPVEGEQVVAGLVEAFGKPTLGNRHTHAVAETLA